MSRSTGYTGGEGIRGFALRHTVFDEDLPISQEAIPAVEPERKDTTGPGKPKSCGPLAVVPLEYFVTVERIVS